MPERRREAQIAESTNNNQLRYKFDGALSAVDLREMIARLAYDYYKLRGAEPGDELSDWLRAEAEVVTMLLGEPLDSEKPHGLANGTTRKRRVMNTDNGPKPIVSRSAKHKNILKSDSA